MITMRNLTLAFCVVCLAIVGVASAESTDQAAPAVPTDQTAPAAPTDQAVPAAAADQATPAAPTEPTTPKAPKITVKIEGLENTKGNVIVSVYNDPEKKFPSLPNAMKSITEAIKDANMQVVIEGLAPGDYAIGVIHDENADGELKTWFFGPPKEGVGMSGEAGGMMPSFEKSKFTLADKDLELTIKMKYIM